MSKEHDPVVTLEDILDALLSTKPSFYDANVSIGGDCLGPPPVMKRGAMTIEYINRRRLVIKDDEEAAGENRWLDIATKALVGTPPETKVWDVLPEDEGIAAANMERPEGQGNGDIN